MVAPCTINSFNRTISSAALLDIGATGKAFVDQTFAQKYSLPLTPLRTHRTLKVVDGRSSSAGDITHTTILKLSINGHLEEISAFVTKLGQYDIILGLPWFALHNPSTNFAAKTIHFDKRYCRHNCLPNSHFQSIVLCDPLSFNKTEPTTEPPRTITREKPLPQPETPKNHPQDRDNPAHPRRPRRIGAAAFDLLSRQAGVVIDSFSLYEIDQRIKVLSPYNSPPNLTLSDRSAHPHSTKPSEYRPPLQVHAISDVKTASSQLDSNPLSPNERHKLAANLYLSGASIEDVQIALKKLDRKTPPVDPCIKLPPHHHQFADVFDASAADKLPPHRPTDHTFELKPGTTPPAGPLYNMSIEELQVLRKWLAENLDKGFIRASQSPAASPVLFAHKPGGGLRFCVDYRGLNAITIKNRYPLPLIQETLSRLSKARYYTKLDVIGAFNQIRIAEGQEWLTAFNTRYGLFESLVMPFGLTNAPATFQSYINSLLRPYLDVFCTAYIDDILIYSDDLTSHRLHVHTILETLQKAGLKLDINKSEFEVQEVTYLGLIISTSGVRMDPSKVQCIMDWESPSCIKDLQSFLGFANFYRRFIKGFSRIVTPLNALTRKDQKWIWTNQHENAFQNLKVAFTIAPTLQHFDPEKKVFVETDASDYVSSGILSQMGRDGVLHPVAFMSRKHSPTECNYEIYDKELLAIVRCFEDWRAELQGVAQPISVITDHRNLEYFMTTKQLSRRQVRWSEFLSQFDFSIGWRSGRTSKKPDSLTRRSQDLPSDDSDPRVSQQSQALLKSHNLTPSLQHHIQNTLTLTSASVTESSQRFSYILSPAIIEPPPNEPMDHKIARLLEEGYKTDIWYSKIRTELTQTDHIPHSRDISLSECELRNDRLYFRNRLYVPDTDLRLQLLETAHSSAESGHPGRNKLYELLSRDYFWPSLRKAVKQYVANCHSCLRAKTSRKRYQGHLKPLPLPIQRWRDISMDFIGPLPESNGHNAILVVICRLSKERHFIPACTNWTAKDLADAFVRNVWKLHGFPDTIVSDRGSTFISEFWRCVCTRIGTTVTLSTAFHPETDGQTEITNAYLEQYLRQFIDISQTDWDNWLPLAEFAANDTVSDPIGMSPFFANKGYHPRTSFSAPRPLPSNSSPHIKLENEAGTAWATEMENILDTLRSNLLMARLQQEEAANANRDPAPAYRKDDLVFLDARNIVTDRPMKKLDHKYLGPYKIKEVQGSHNYRLDLPHEMRSIHNSFHTSLLRPCPIDPYPGQTNPPPPPIAIDEYGEKIWAIDSILDSRHTKSKTFEYLILWRGYSIDDATWEPLHHVITAKTATSEFHKRFPQKKQPTEQEIAQAKKKNAIPS